MITVDKQRFEMRHLLSRFNEMTHSEAFRNPEGKRYAVCVDHAFDLVSIVLYLRKRGGSVLLMHADTPVDTARTIAFKANCSYLLYEKWSASIRIGVSQDAYESSILQYSSGTTGEPKLVARSWEQVDREILQYNQQFCTSPDEEPLILVPVSHSFGLIAGVLTALAREAEPTIVQDKNPKYALHAIKSTKKSIVYGVPFMFHLLDSLGKGEVYFHKLVSSGAPLSESLLKLLKARTNEVWQQYGCTEAGCISLGAQPSSPMDMGMPLGHLQLSIRTDRPIFEEGAMTGEIVVYSESVEIRTLDLGRIDPLTGRLHVLGRLDDLINVSGLKVIPSEVENVIGRLHGITESVVFKTEHKIWGEAVKAMVVASPDVYEHDVRAWCIKHLPAYKVPSIIERVAEIPKLPNGKISRIQLQRLERISNDE